MTAMAMNGTVNGAMSVNRSISRGAALRSHTLGGSTAGTRLRLTPRGRRFVAVLAALPAAIALSIAVISGGAALASRDTGVPAESFSTVTVTAGDSLWSIAEDVAPQADPRDVVDAIARLNALDGVEVSAGQTLAIPAEYAAP